MRVHPPGRRCLAGTGPPFLFAGIPLARMLLRMSRGSTHSAAGAARAVRRPCLNTARSHTPRLGGGSMLRLLIVEDDRDVARLIASCARVLWPEVRVVIAP